MKKLEELIRYNMKRQQFDSIAVGVIDFKNQNFNTIDLGNPTGMYFDLASLTKPLTLAFTYHHFPELFDENLFLLLNHKAGLPAWGRLSKCDWKEQILSYEIKKSNTIYSDFSALRLMLEIEKRTKKSMGEITNDFWDQEVVFWKDLSEVAVCPFTGFRNGVPICGDVKDDKAYVIGEFTTHAGLFGTIVGVCRTLLKLDQSHGFVFEMSKLLPNSERFVCGWDVVQNPNNTMAGVGCSMKTFGHLGFTGTSIWIDAEKMLGHVILTNATQNYWYERDGVNELRRTIGEWVWQRL